ncbi:MAG: hypothetical protein CME66_01735 [Halobacteriovoraceae bacterium]|nr:hypothetical protein [Halobacteriovoraceae bacterium]
MNNKLFIFSILVIFVFGYAVYEGIKLDKKFSVGANKHTGSVIKEIPKNVSFKNLQGEDVLLNKVLDGKKSVFVHFWATWCAPCEVEFPELVDFINEMKNKDIVFALVAVNDDLPKIKKFLKRFKAQDLENTLILRDDNNEFNKFGTYKLPESFVFNSSGSLVKLFSGQQPWTQKYIIDIFNSL